MNAHNAQMEAPGQNDLELIDERSPLATLECDIKNLHNCFDSYREQLSTALDCPEVPGRWVVRFSKTTAGLFGAVILFTLVLNVLLTAMRADQQQLLQANCGIGILYALVCMSVLNDIASANSVVRSESEALQLRVLDVMDQFRELLRTRQAWVEESTRTQWSCETDKLKLQLAEQELQAKHASIAQCRTTWEDLQKSISIAEAQAGKLAQDVAKHTAQIEAAQADHTSLLAAVRQLETERAGLVEQISECKQEVEDAEQKLAAVNLATDEAQRELEVTQSSIAGLREEASMCEAIVAEQSGLAAELRQQVEAARQEADAAKLMFETTLGQTETAQQQLDTTTQQLAIAAQQLAETERLIASLQQEVEVATSNAELRRRDREELDSQIAELSEQRLKQAEQLATVSQELICLREQKENFAAENSRMVEDVLHQEQRQAELLQQFDGLNTQVHQQEKFLADLTQQEATLQARVDWLLGQCGEFERLSLAQVASTDSIDALEANMKVGQANVDALKLEEETLQATIAELRESIAGLMQDAQHHQKHVEDLKSQSDNFAADIDEIQALTEECRREFADLTSSKRQQIADRQAELQNWDDKLQQRRQEFEALSAETIVAKEQLTETQGHLHVLADELREAQTLLASAQQSYTLSQQAERVAEENAALLLEKAESIAEQVRLRSDELHSAALELEGMRAEIRSLETVRVQFDALVNDSDRLETRLGQQRAEAIDSSARIDSLSSQEGELQTEVDRLTQLVSELRGELDTLDAETQQRQSQLDAHRCELENAHEIRDTLDREVALMNSEMNRLAEQMRTAEYNFDARIAELEQLDSVRSTMNVEIERLQGQLAQLDRAAEDEQAKLRAITESYQTKAQSLTDIQQSLETESIRQQQLENQCTKLTSEAERLNGRVDSLTSEVNESQVIANQWQEYIEKLKREIERLETDKQGEQRLLDDAKRRVQQQQDRHADVLSQVAMAADELADKEIERARLETQARELHKEIARAEDNQVRLLEQIDQADSALDALLQEQATVQQSLNSVRVQLAGQHTTLHEMEAQQELLRAGIESAEVHSRQLETMIGDLQSDKAELEESTSQLLQTKQQLEVEIERANTQRQLGEEELFQMQSQKQHAQMQLDDIKQEIVQAAAQLNAVTSDHDRQLALSVVTNRQLLDLQERLQRVDAELIAKTRELADGAAELARQNETTVSVQEQLDSTLKQIEQLRTEDEQLHARRIQLTQDLAEQQLEAGKLIALAKHAHRGLQQLTQDARDKETQLSHVQQQLASGEAEVQRNFVRLVDLRNEVTELELLRKEQEQLLQQVELQLAGQSTVLANVQQRIESSQAAKLALERNLMQLTSQNERAAQELRGLESRQEQVRDQYELQLGEQQQAIDEATQRYEQLLSEEAEVRARIEELHESARDANDRLSELTVKQQQAEAVLIAAAPEAEQTTPGPVELPAPEAQPSRLQSLEADVWGAVQSLSQIARDARMANASTAGAAAMVDPWATVLADRS